MWIQLAILKCLLMISYSFFIFFTIRPAMITSHVFNKTLMIKLFQENRDAFIKDSDLRINDNLVYNKRRTSKNKVISITKIQELSEDEEEEEN